MAQDTKENGMSQLIRETAEVTKSGQMGLCMKDTGEMTKLMVEAD